MLPSSAVISGTLALLIGAQGVAAQTATQVVRFEVNAINQIGVSGSPAPLVINTAIAGSAPTSVTVDGTSYAVTTNEQNQKITASLDQPMPAGMTLEIALSAPIGAASAGPVALGTSGADVVTGISSVAAVALPITYRLRATPVVQVSAAAARIVTFTIVSGT
jgi:hypothetical protein